MYLEESMIGQGVKKLLAGYQSRIINPRKHILILMWSDLFSSGHRGEENKADRI
jgi:hypothetical protein